jgi:hypothetical protein
MSRDEKWCSRCEQAKPVAEYGINRARRDGLSVYCLLCTREATSISLQKWRKLALAALGGRCASCGFDDHRALQFDHINGGGSARRASGERMSTPMLKKIVNGEYHDELQILCANCNWIKVAEKAERFGKRKYNREIPTERNDRPNARWTPEQRAAQSRRAKALWQDPEKRATIVAAQVETGRDPALRALRSRAASENMKRRWASGEVPSRRRPKEADLST